MLNAPKSQPRVLCPAGTHKARCVGLIYEGTVKTEWQGKEMWQDKIRLTFELPEKLAEFNGEKKPFVISREFTLSLGEKSNLLPIVEGIVGFLPPEVVESFNVEDLLGKTCLISVKHKTTPKGEYASLETASPLMEGMEVPAQFNPTTLLTYENWQQEVFDKLPAFIKEKMQGSKQYVAKFGKTETDDIQPDDIPF
jgi:hypothetical protein